MERERLIENAEILLAMRERFKEAIRTVQHQITPLQAEIWLMWFDQFDMQIQAIGNLL